ncbi:S-adenosylmethionine/tRNA-ribosyltransferase- isomerase [Thermincola ferriacetica]|uniref:S-adenosylmethionine:tRNA ribosyltransferase-isomerase n=1 Tax=Thermincola ferriacetica TaxID=281456 RepID=A0A0L6W6C2_9FIRM|nr:tRNA preQ1(34) S-adenosylmethionine ribosyltransferase-isomerase QueA [Thermincola ferriacetica]KNZ71070.1 S-adenosylmethionine/tRNA-ribosyltransferase- isomerase [Thermincola ferriacetica]
MKVADFDFELPEELIAQEPVEPRDHSRLLVVNRDNGNIEHKRFYNCIDYIEPGDVLVVNNTRVLPARLFGEKKGSGAKIEFVLLKRIDRDKWEVLVKPGKRVKPGTVIFFGGGLLEAFVLQTTESGGRLVEFRYEGIFEELLDRFGQMPLPPYIKKQLDDRERYQTVYARASGSAAAPTAGLHFTEELLKKMHEKGVVIAEVMLHVGLGTFRPVKVDNVEDHRMHAEYYEINEETANLINRQRDRGHKIIAVGTTSCRALETAADSSGNLKPGCGWTDIFIYPGYRFKAVDRLITNFHLPRSTLIMLVSAFAGKDLIMRAYQEAIAEKYRFFSFGDAMMIL